MINQTETRKIDRHAHGVVGGIILVLAGVGMLLSQWLRLDLGDYAVLLLSAAMLAWGIYSHAPGWIIAGSILAGIGTGIVVFNGPWNIASEYQPGVFLLCFALGWFLIPVLTRLFTTCPMVWPFIPGGIMAIIGCTLLVVHGSMQQQIVNALQASLLILGGLYLILRKRRAS